MITVRPKIFGKSYSIKILPSFFILLFLSLVNGLESLALTLLLFSFVLIHEFGHVLMAKSFEVDCDKIHLSFFGGTAFLKDPLTITSTPFKQIALITLAGPAVNVVFIALGLILYHFTQIEFFAIVAGVNLLLAVFNLLPVYPLDGGRLLEAVCYKLFPKHYKTYTFYIGVVFSLGVLALVIFTKSYLSIITLLFVWFELFAYRTSKA